MHLSNQQQQRSAFVNNTSQRGIAVLLLVVIIGVAALILTVGGIFLSLNDLESGFVSTQGSEALAIVDGCMDEAYYHLGVTTTYTGGTLSIGDGSCIITVTSTAAPTYGIVVSSTIGNYNRKVSSEVNVSGTIVTTLNWKERTD